MGGLTCDRELNGVALRLCQTEPVTVGDKSVVCLRLDGHVGRHVSGDVSEFSPVVWSHDTPSAWQARWDTLWDWGMTL